MFYFIQNDAKIREAKNKSSFNPNEVLSLAEIKANEFLAINKNKFFQQK